MQLYYHKRFKKQYQKLTPQLQQKVEKAIQHFKSNPFDPRFRNHALMGDSRGLRAISVTGDIRIVFEEFNNYQEVKLLRVGTHSQVY